MFETWAKYWENQQKVTQNLKKKTKHSVDAGGCWCSWDTLTVRSPASWVRPGSDLAHHFVKLSKCLNSILLDVGYIKDHSYEILVRRLHTELQIVLCPLGLIQHAQIMQRAARASVRRGLLSLRHTEEARQQMGLRTYRTGRGTCVHQRQQKRTLHLYYWAAEGVVRWKCRYRVINAFR